ncbi:MAG: hypothetical protein R3313_03880 [Candidatus Saccharimonadales bacterium]|nr:hypothetical protein [Candidatus Saccharimonadales bacterium]
MTQPSPSRDPINVAQQKLGAFEKNLTERRSALEEAEQEREEAIAEIAVMLEHHGGRVQYANLDEEGQPDGPYKDLTDASIIRRGQPMNDLRLRGMRGRSITLLDLEKIDLQFDSQSLIPIRWEIDGIFTGNARTDSTLDLSRSAIRSRQKETLKSVRSETKLARRGILTGRTRWLHGIMTHDQVQNLSLGRYLGNEREFLGGRHRSSARKIEALIGKHLTGEAAARKEITRKQVLVDAAPEQMAQAVATRFAQAAKSGDRVDELRALGSLIVVNFGFSESRLKAAITEGVQGIDGVDTGMPANYDGTKPVLVGDRQNGQYAHFLAWPEHGTGPAEEMIGTLTVINEFTA